MSSITIEQAYEVLAKNKDFRVLRRIKPVFEFSQLREDEPRAKILVLDTETTGFDVEKNELIEIGASLVEVSLESFKLGAVLDAYSGLEDYKGEMDEGAFNAHGITKEEVAGKSFDEAAFKALAMQADYFLAHNAAFDRSFLDKRFPWLKSPENAKTWICSFKEINWTERGYMGAKLGYILNGCGYFHDAHRAVEDTTALMHVLNEPLLDDQTMPMAVLLESAKQAQHLIRAVGAAFGVKDILKGAGYRWNADLKTWEIEVFGQQAFDDQMVFLHKQIYVKPKFGVPVITMQGPDRYGKTETMRPVIFQYEAPVEVEELPKKV